MHGNQPVLPALVFLVSVRVTWLAQAPALQGMEENCILSFVVPKEKMKSSCEMDEKINRRLSAMDMKVNMYMQHVSDLQIQLEKERQLSKEKFEQFEKLHREFMGSKATTDTSPQIDRRFGLLEAGIEQLRTDMTFINAIANRARSLPHDKSISPVFNSSKMNSNTLHQAVRSVIHTEVNGLFERFSKRFEKYVQEQVILYNLVFRSVDASVHSGSSSMYVPTAGSKRENTHKQLELGDKTFKEDFKKVQAKLNDTSNKIAKHVGTYIKNIASLEYINVTDIPGAVSTATTKNADPSLINNSGLEAVEELSENKESYSGENSDADLTSPSNTFTSLNAHLTSPRDTFTSLNSISGSASSRMSPSEADANLTEPENDEKLWKGNTVQRPSSKKINEIEQRLKEEITVMLYPPLAEMLSLIEKQKSGLEDKIKLQDERWNIDLTRHVNELNTSIQTIDLHVQSLSQGFHDSFIKLDRIKPLEILVNEIKRNLTTDTLTVSALENEEQSKKFKKLERLMSICHHSLEHYRNETKHEYREIRESLENEIITFRTFSKALRNDMADKLSSEMSRLNNSWMSRFHEISEQARSHEEALQLIQTDIDNVEKMLQNKRKLSDNDFDEIQKLVNQITAKQRDFRKKFDHLEQTQTSMNESFWSYAKDLTSLRTEIKLNLDQWLQVTFEYDSSRTDCFGEQYVKRARYSQVKLVGVVLCSPTRYKLFLSPSLQSKFMNIGDGSGMGEDHCEFVGAAKDAKITLSPYKPSYGAIQGYARNQWGQEPVLSYLNAIKPSPYWYECGLQIP